MEQAICNVMHCIGDDLHLVGAWAGGWSPPPRAAVNINHPGITHNTLIFFHIIYV